jgi:membrane associated rhomboid family serine protease
MTFLIPLLKFSADVPHPAVTIIGAFVVAAVAALLGQGNVRARAHYAAYIAGCCVAVVIAGSWAMRLIER